jgi:hypothetical protein
MQKQIQIVVQNQLESLALVLIQETERGLIYENAERESIQVKERVEV